MNIVPKNLRCAVYTRKSTEHNLDLEFNSLHAQREACEAYIKSQIHEGWQLVADCYDDGGWSGASLDRPGLRRLLADIAAGKVDTVVVYKVDRLSRSLTDFARLVELFDKHAVSFVSVTQSFNTTSSMGRLTLNVLLSFAQFEREVIGERVRDKIAASKKKGLFMGGSIPLGYTNRDKKLVVVAEEAESIRWIFRKYLEVGAIRPLLRELDRAGIKTKPRRHANGTIVGGGRFGKGGLNHLLKNRRYIGELVHRGEVYHADHEPILDRVLFDAVQANMAVNNVEKKLRERSSPYLLTGLIFDSVGNRMTPTHTVKKGVRYRYYFSQAAAQGRKEEAGAVVRVPAPDIEDLVGGYLVHRAGTLTAPISRDVLDVYISRVTVQAQAVELALRHTERPENGVDQASNSSPEIVLLPWTRKPFISLKGVAPTPSEPTAVDPRAREAVLTAIGKARLWVEEVLGGVSLAEIAKREGKGERQIRLLVPLAFLSPGEVRRIIDYKAPVMTVTEIAKDVRLVWQ